MKQLKEYDFLRKLYRRSIKKLKIPFFVSLLIFALGFASFAIEDFPFELSLAMMGMIFLALFFGPLWLVSGIKTKMRLKNFSGHQLDRINREAPSCAVCEGIFVTSQAVIGARLGLELVPMATLLWVYASVTTEKLEGLIPIYKYTMLSFAGRDHKQRGFKIKNNQEAYDFVQTELLKYRQDIIFGYEDGLDNIYQNDINRMIAFSQECAEKRKKIPDQRIVYTGHAE